MAKNASGPQLWRLNQAGRLQITHEPVEPIAHDEAWDLVSTLAVDRAAASKKAA